eukprot:jgi/Ulvmu1/1490/UM011_0220.1
MHDNDSGLGTMGTKQHSGVRNRLLNRTRVNPNSLQRSLSVPYRGYPSRDHFTNQSLKFISHCRICNVGVQSSCQPGQHEHCGAHMRHSAASGLMHHYQQRRYKHGHKRKGSFMERIKKTANGEFIAHHPHYRHKRYQKSRSQLNRLKGTFVLPKFLQRKLRKAGF